MDLPDLTNREKDFSHISADSLNDSFNSYQDDYYAILNLPRNASDDDVKSAYKRLSMIYHPDKLRGNVPEEGVEHAANQFSMINSAYQVLSDSRTRLVYDEFGTEGLKDMMQLSTNVIDNDKMREELLQMKYIKDKGIMEDILKSSPTQMKVGIDLSPLLDGIEGEIGVSEIQLIHSDEMNLSPTLNTSISGVISAQNSRGEGYVMNTLSKTSSLGVFQSSIAIGTMSFAEVKYSSRFWKYYDLETSLYGNSYPWRVSPISKVVVGRPLGTGLYATVTYSTDFFSWVGQDSSGKDLVKVDVYTTFPRGSLNYSGVLGAKELGFSTKGAYKYDRLMSLNSSIGWAISTGLELGFGAKINVKPNYRISSEVSLNDGGLVILTASLTRFTSTLSIPFILSESLSLKSLGFATVSMLVYSIVGRRISKLLRAQTPIDLKSKASAEKDVEIMRLHYTKKCNAELEKGGLVIQEAFYGLFEIDSPGITEQSFDVMVQLQLAVNESRLVLASGTKSKLLGFWDPCPGIEKFLFIKYSYKNRDHSVLYHDEEAVQIPQKIHQNPR